MKKIIIFLLLVLGLSAENFAQEFKIITVVESIIPMGVGRSRIIENQTDVNSENFTTSRTAGTDSQQSNIKRSSLKVDEFNETKLLNFYSGTGINFQNISSNDAIIASKINTMTSAGWRLTFISSGVESNAGETDNTGIFITRLYFSRD
jgi:hypothetical protein